MGKKVKTPPPLASLGEPPQPSPVPAEFSATRLPEVVLIKPKIYHDPRGFFFESFKQSDFSSAGLPSDFVQENYSYSKANVIRGLHYQRPPKAQAKLVRVVSGSVWDVFVDIRPNSPRFGHWHGEVLSDENCHQLFIPAGFAHGFKVLTDSATVLYRTTQEYAPELEGGIQWNDPMIGISWDIPTPLISERDHALPTLEEETSSGGLDCFRLDQGNE